jgi:hypothetical protein
MVSLSLAWVLVTLIKNKKDFDMGALIMFMFTGFFDLIIMLAIFGG